MPITGKQTWVPTPEQSRVLGHESGPGLVVATAGSGKTACLIAYIDRLRTRGVKPDRILCVTFTKAAKDQMLPRLVDLTGDSRWASRVDFRTLHSLAYRMVTRSNGAPDAKTDNSSLIRACLLKLRLPADQYAVDGAANDITRFVGGLRPSSFAPNSLNRSLFDQVLEDYRVLKSDRGTMDMDDLLEQAVSILESSSSDRAFWQNAYDFILVDEHQDTNPLQWKLLQLVLPPRRPNILCVGDDDQSIYGWRGATPRIMMDFPEFFPGAPIYRMGLNQRSLSSIVESAARLISCNANRYRKPIRASKAGGVRPEIRRPGSAFEEIDDIVRDLANFKSRPEALVQIAVLYRTNAQALGFIAAFEREAIPFTVFGTAPDPFGRWMARDILSYIRLGYGRASQDDVSRVLKRPSRKGLGAQVTKSLLEFLPKTHSISTTDLSIAGRKAGPRVRLIIDDLCVKLAVVRSMNVNQAIQYILQKMEYRRGIEEFCAWLGSNPNEAVEHLQSISLMFKPDDPADKLLDEVSTSRGRRLRKNDRPKGVTLSTMHSAKGLEWDTVYVTGAISTKHPLETHAGSSDLEEERRLFYVAMTRARRRLVISVPRSWCGALTSPSPFLREARLW